MSTLKGEQSLKKPLSFEFTWTARHLLEIMEERAVAIHSGGLPGEFGVDLRLAYSDREEHHQVKRTFGSKGEWTLSALGEVLTDFKQRLDDPLVHCWFVSTIPAVRLGYLGDKARDSDSLNDFEEKWLTGDYRGWFEDLVNRWQLSREDCRQRLKRVHTAALDERQIENACLTMLRAMVTSSPVDAWAHLRDFCFDHTHQRITAAEVWQWLTARGVERQIIPGDSRLLVSINHQTTEYLSGVRRKLINPPLVRQVSGTIVSTLASATFCKDVIVLGAPGGGKSAVMLQIADACLAKGWPVLAFRLDELSATTTSTQLQEALGLPLPPGAAMAKASAGKPAVVIIDQLDAVSQYSGRTGTLFDRVSDLIEQIRAHQLRNPIHLVVTCREVDWRQDGRFRRLHRPTIDNPEEGIFKVEGLFDEEIKAILANAGYDAASFSPRQRDLLLRRPQYLAILLETHPDAESLQHIVTPKQLFDAYWEQKELALAQDIHSASNVWHGVLKCITHQLAETALAITPAIPDGGDDAPLAVKKSLIADFPPQAVRWLISNGVLAESGSRYRFAHESFFDYCFARFFEERGQTLVAYLLDSDQTLIQRGQVRQVLAYQRDEGEDMALYLDSVRDLLEHDQVRPHLKHLVATVICDVASPTEAEWQFLVPILEAALTDIDAGNRTTTSCQVFFAFHRSLPFFRMACESGRFAGWLQRVEPPGIVSLFSTIHCHQEKAQALVWRLIEPLVGEPRFEQALENLSHSCHAAESRETFEWLLSMMRKVYSSDEKPHAHEERFYSLTSDIAKHRPNWLAEWLAAVVVEQAKHDSDHGYELLKPSTIETDKIAPAVESAPKAFLECFLPAIEQVLQRGVGRWFGTWSDFDNDDSIQYRSPDRAMFDALVDALTSLLKTEGAYATAILNHLRSSEFVALQRLNAAVLCQNQDESAPLAAEFLAKDDHAFKTSLGGKLAACEMIRKHARRLTPDQSSSIQKRILVCWPQHESKKRQSYDSRDSDNCRGNWRGYCQQQLLATFPHDLLEPLSRRRLEEWERKFTSVERLSLPRRKTNLINKERVIEWSPTRFLEAVIVCQDRAPASSWRGRDDLDGKVSCILAEAVAKRPDEFISFLGQCGTDATPAFIESIYLGLANLSLEAALALEASRQFKRLGAKWARSAVRMLGKIEAEPCIREAIPDALHFALSGELPEERSKPEEGKRGAHLDATAFDSVRATAIETLAQYLWAVPELLEELKPSLPALMSEQHPAIQAKLAMLCYAIAFKSEHRDLATELFVRLVENPTDEHVLCSRWPFKFMHAGIVDSWAAFRTILERMMASESSEIRSTVASLVCIAVVRGVETLDLAKQCVASSDPKVRAACANVLSHNLDQDTGKPWTTEAVLTLADDPDKEVCRAVSSGFQGRRRSLDFASLTDFLPKYVRSRAFVRGAGSLIDAITESHAVLPSLILDLIESTISRANEPVEDDADRIVWHLQSLSAVLTRIYHENRDGPLRYRTLDLIDKLCIQGAISQDTLDQ